MIFRGISGFLFTWMFALSSCWGQGLCSFVQMGKALPTINEDVLCDSLRQPPTAEELNRHALEQILEEPLVRHAIAQESDSLVLKAAQALAAGLTNLGLHEVAHAAAAAEQGATDQKLYFFKEIDGSFRLAHSSHRIRDPEAEHAPIKIAGYSMEQEIFNLSSEVRNKTQSSPFYWKSLQVFSSSSFLLYTLYSNYVKPDESEFDPKSLRDILGASKEQALIVVSANTLLNWYRMVHPNAAVSSTILTTRERAGILLNIHF